MSNEQSISTLENQDELTVLKQRADKMGIKYSNNISAETLRNRINDHLEGKTSASEEPTKAMTKRQDINARRTAMILEKTKLVRVRVTNNDQRQKGIPGEFFTVGNGLIGTYTKYIPYGNGTEDGYHIPQIMVDFLKDKKYLHMSTVRDRNTGKERVKRSLRPKFTIEILPPLTEKELKELAQRQIATRSLDDED